MKYVLILDHPYGLQSGHNEPHNRSFTAALAQSAIDQLTAAGHTVDVIDLHQDQFDPVMHKEELTAWRTAPFVDAQSQDYLTRLRAADQLIFVFPIWWELMPAMTKGFLDKVLAKHQANVHSKQLVLTKNPTIHILTTMGTPTAFYKFYFGNPIMKAMYRGTFKKIGLKHVKWHNFNAEDWSAQKRTAVLNNIAQKLN